MLISNAQLDPARIGAEGADEAVAEASGVRHVLHMRRGLKIAATIWMWGALALGPGCGGAGPGGGSDAGTDAGSDDGTGEPEALAGTVAAHNKVRAEVSPAPAEPLPALSWSAELAEVAQAYAEECVWEHSTNGYGENLFMSTYAPTPEEVVESWASEDQFYDFETNSCAPGQMCGHYTQLVWAGTTSVGCGFAECSSIQGLPFGGVLWVCNYDPPGNWLGQWPYVAAE